jgi:hypothetical protein
MLFLFMNISYHHGQAFLAKGKNSIIIPPVELKIGPYDVIDVMRSVPLYIADEPGGRQFGRDGRRDVYMIFDAANGVDDPTHFLSLCGDGAIQVRLEHGSDQRLPVFGPPNEVIIKFPEWHGTYSPFSSLVSSHWRTIRCATISVLSRMAISRNREFC